MSIVPLSKGQVSMNLCSTTTTLESMSNELLMELFEYFDWYSLYFIFSSLNSRFDCVLTYVHNIDVNLDCIPSNRILSHIIRHLPSLGPHRIGSLRSSIRCHSELVLRDELVVDHFSCIRSLTLLNIDDETDRLFNIAIYHLAVNLVHLSLSYVNSNRWYLYLSIYPKLRQCLLPNATFPSNLIHLQPNTVQYLQISHKQSLIHEVATILLAHSPHLRRLNLHVASDIDESSNIRPFVRPSSLPPSALIHLTVQSSFLFFVSIEWLLAYVPRLRTLHVQVMSSCERMVNPNEWKRVLPSNLTRLDVKVEVKELTILPLEISQENNDFWQSRQWIVTIVGDPISYLHMHS